MDRLKATRRRRHSRSPQRAPVRRPYTRSPAWDSEEQQSRAGLPGLGGEAAQRAELQLTGFKRHHPRKHKKAVYIPSQCQKEPRREYSYGPRVRLAMRTDFLRLLRALAAGAVYYDPGVKVEQASTARSSHKGRSQFRVVSRNIPSLYETVELVEVRTFSRSSSPNPVTRGGMQKRDHTYIPDSPHAAAAQLCSFFATPHLHSPPREVR